MIKNIDYYNNVRNQNLQKGIYGTCVGQCRNCHRKSFYLKIKITTFKPTHSIFATNKTAIDNPVLCI